MPMPFDEEAYRAVQEPHVMPDLPVVMCARCKKPLMIRARYDPDWEEYIVAVGCHGEVQSVGIRTLTPGFSRPLVLSIIENLSSVFQPE